MGGKIIRCLPIVLQHVPGRPGKGTRKGRGIERKVGEGKGMGEDGMRGEA